MILVIDTSASTAAVALINGVAQDLVLPARSQDLVPQLRRIAHDSRITKVAVATGPGSFTGLRVGVSFGLGLAMGLKIPIVALPTLGLQAARSQAPVTAVVEAGRGRFYFQAPGADAALGDPAGIPHAHRLVGRLSAAGKAALLSAGHALVDEGELRPFSEAARSLLESAPEVGYSSLKLEYMQNFTGKI